MDSPEFSRTDGTEPSASPRRARGSRPPCAEPGGRRGHAFTSPAPFPVSHRSIANVDEDAKDAGLPPGAVRESSGADRMRATVTPRLPASPHDLVIALSWTEIRTPYRPDIVTFTMTPRRLRRFDQGAPA